MELTEKQMDEIWSINIDLTGIKDTMFLMLNDSTYNDNIMNLCATSLERSQQRLEQLHNTLFLDGGSKK